MASSAPSPRLCLSFCCCVLHNSAARCFTHGSTRIRDVTSLRPSFLSVAHPVRIVPCSILPLRPFLDDEPSAACPPFAVAGVAGGLLVPLCDSFESLSNRAAPPVFKGPAGAAGVDEDAALMDWLSTSSSRRGSPPP